MMRLRLLLAGLLTIVAVPHAGAAPTHTLTLVLDRTGSAEVHLPSFSIESASMTETAKGIGGLVMERLGERHTSTGSWLMAQAARLDSDRPIVSLVSFRDDPFEAGRYRLSTTAVAGAKSTLTLRVAGLNRDVTVRPVARRRLATGGVQRLDRNGATGTFEGDQQLTTGTVNRAFALVSVGEQTSTAGGFVGQNQICLVRVEQDCGVPFGYTTQFLSPTPFGSFITGVYGPDQVPTGRLSGHQRVTGVSTPSRAWGWSILVDAGP